MTDPTEQMLRFFAYEHLPINIQDTSRVIGKLAHELFNTVPSGTEKTMGMRKLLEAKDCFVRAVLSRGDEKVETDGDH